LGARLGVVIGKADADAVKAASGYSIGGVPPLGLLTPMRTVLDESLLALPVLWAAAGSATAVFSIEPDELVRLSGAEVLPIG
ncbi:MAG TPA: YbaK/EbsC family protein, partial [Gemmatimonadales bacterium]